MRIGDIRDTLDKETRMQMRLANELMNSTLILETIGKSMATGYGSNAEKLLGQSMLDRAEKNQKLLETFEDHTYGW